MPWDWWMRLDDLDDYLHDDWEYLEKRHLMSFIRKFLGRSIHIIPHKLALNRVEFNTSKYVDKFLWKSTYFIMHRIAYRWEVYDLTTDFGTGYLETWITWYFDINFTVDFMWKKILMLFKSGWLINIILFLENLPLVSQILLRK